MLEVDSTRNATNGYDALRGEFDSVAVPTHLAMASQSGTIECPK